MNPSEVIALALAESYSQVESMILPVEFQNAFHLLKDKLGSWNPDYLIMLGQAKGRKDICFEKVGLNWMESDVKDEAGVRPESGKILKESDLALMSRFPIETAFLEMKKAQLPFSVSFSAGTYVCNELYFRVLENFKDLRSVFIHVPIATEQLKPGESVPTISIAGQIKCLKFLIAFMLTAVESRP